MKENIKEKTVAGALSVLFLALVRTDADPQMWQVALIALVLYECAVMTIKIAQKEARHRRRNRIIRIRQQDARRWAEEWFNPYREVS